MTNSGDDCYFYYYSTCTKGDSCPFRHVEAALGSEIVCNLWKEGRCFRAVCKFRHAEITKNRKEISCYWENQVTGCQKPHCAFFHEKPRFIEGIFVPPDKNSSNSEEQPQEELAPPPAAPIPTAVANPQLRGVIKTEAQDPVPSPTHPPVVINPADDDEDEDDQFSEEGEDGKVGPSPRKLNKSGDSLNFGVSTLEEIRLRKALKASMKRAGYPIQSSDTGVNGEKENIRSLFDPSILDARHDPIIFDTVRPRVSMAERLGRKVPSADVRGAEGVPLKRSLADRLGRVVNEDDPLMPPQKALKPVRDRLGLSAGAVSPSQSAESEMEAQKEPEQILIKTLDQIRQEKAAKTKKDGPAPAPENITTKPTRGVKRAITIKDNSINEIKTFSEILHAKKKREEEQNLGLKKDKSTAGKAAGKKQDVAGSGPQVTAVGVVKVKTLEEIRREKAARMQAQQDQESENKKNSDSEEADAKRPRLQRLNKPASQTGNGVPEKTPEVTEKPIKPQAAAPETSAANGNAVKVKTFEEIMREKRLRRQEMEEQAKAPAEADPSQKQPEEETLKRKIPARVTFKSLGSSSPSSSAQAPDTTAKTRKLPVRKMFPIRSTAASPPNSTTGSSNPATQSSPQPESCSQSPSSAKEVQNRSATLSPAKPAPRGPAAEAPAAEKTSSSNQKMSPEHSTDTRVRPKLNVKPSVVKPVQVKPGQKRKAAQRSAVAAVKPLNSAITVQEEQLHETTRTDKQEFPSSSAEDLLSSAVPSGPSALQDSGCSLSPLTEELQTVPTFKLSLNQETKMAVSVPATKEACAVPQSPVQKPLPKSRRTSTVVSTSAVDDFEDLISEFTNDPLEEDVDPAIGEDDLLLELSEMIDS